MDWRDMNEDTLIQHLAYVIDRDRLDPFSVAYGVCLSALHSGYESLSDGDKLIFEKEVVPAFMRDISL